MVVEETEQRALFSPQADGANTRRKCRGDGFAAVWPGEPGRVWVRYAAPTGQASLLWDHTYGCNEVSSKFTLIIKHWYTSFHVNEQPEEEAKVGMHIEETYTQVYSCI